MNPFTNLTVTTADGRELAARCYVADAAALRRVVVIACALGVPQTFYQRYATWLSAHGCAVYTFDWRDMGLSAPRNLRQSRATLIDWALQDAPSVVHTVQQRHPGLPISWFGHSMGGILYGAMPMPAGIDHVVTLGSGSGYGPHLSRPLRYVIGAFWHVVVPWSVARHGYFAGRRLRMVGDLPRGVVTQWKRWCTSPEFVASEGEHIRAAYAQVRQAITAVVFTDDTMASPRGVQAVHRLYRQAPVRHLVLHPRELGLRRVGHFHFFHPRTGEQGWRVSLPWLGVHHPDSLNGDCHV